MERIEERIEEFILDNFLFGDESRAPSTSTSLMETGVMDSTGVLELIEFVEEEFGIKVDDVDAVSQNFDSIDGMVSFVTRKSTRSDA